MLHHAKVMQALITLQDELFADYSTNIALARASWQRICADPLFAYKIREISSPWLLPNWQGAVNALHKIELLHEPYHVLAVDGSQLYPDRHQGSSCYLINIGAVYMHYKERASMQFESKPYLYSGRQEDELEDSAIEVVNAKRQELELQIALEWSMQLFDQSPSRRQLFLFDGSLIFWHLALQSERLKERYMGSYLRLMYQLYDKKILHAGYISLPKSKELVNLIRVELCNFVADGCTMYKEVDHIVDTTVADFFLKPGERTTIFKSNAVICKQYPEPLVPYFFYMHVKEEIARIEIPMWIASNEEHVNVVAAIAYDQAIKGSGYPVALAEAHEQAVVKGPDREFFYQMLHKLAIEHKKIQSISQKSSKKRIMGV